MADDRAAPNAPDWSNRTIREIVGRRLRQLRIKRKLSQDALAKQAGVTPATVRGIETGARRTQLDKLERVCTVLGTTPDTVCHRLFESGDVESWANPLLRDLIREDLEIAQRYHHAGSSVRRLVERTLEPNVVTINLADELQGLRSKAIFLIHQIDNAPDLDLLLAFIDYVRKLREHTISDGPLPVPPAVTGPQLVR